MDDSLTKSEIREWVFWAIRSKLEGYLIEDIIEVADKLVDWVVGDGAAPGIDDRQRAMMASVETYEEVEPDDVITDAETYLAWLKK